MPEFTCQVLIGKTIVEIHRDREEMIMTDSEGGYARFWHDQDCCESVWIEDVAGDLTDLLHSPLLMAEESISKIPPNRAIHPEPATWTFYKFATAKGYVTIRWCGESNGYYSESVSFEYRGP